MPPIDPLQLLKALSPLLSVEGGIKSMEEVGRLSSLMQKFSKKLVSRCVYINVLRATKPQELEGFLQSGGWAIIHTWLDDTKTQQNHCFLMELLKLYKFLPMTVGRLKENNSAKLVKALTKNEREDIKQMSTDIVNSWMKLVKGDSEVSSKASKDEKVVKKKKKKEDKESVKSDKEKNSIKDKEKKESKKDEAKRENKNSTSKENKVGVKAEELEDVQLPDYIRNPEPKDIAKPKERKSTVKLYKTKFRSTGIDEPVQLPRPPSKKSTEKVPPLIISKNSIKRINPTIKDLGPIPKKPKPPNITLPTKFETPEGLFKEQEKSPVASNERREIKLIAPRPKPIHTITESAGFMDALVAPPTVAVVRKKRKTSTTNANSNKSPTTPSASSPPVAPKLQFYKDTLETSEENGSFQENNKKDDLQKTDEGKEVENMEEDKPGDDTPLSPKQSENENDDASDTSSTVSSNKRKKKSKKVSWADENNLKQIFYFEMDETERVNVNNVKNFGDLKTLERMREREAVESNRRLLVGTDEEMMSWYIHPIDDLAVLVIPGCNSKERDVQKLREESVLQEIFFSKESVPDAPHEPDPEYFEPEEPKIIPLEDENNLDSVIDYSMLEPPAPVTSLPPALSNLFQSLGKSTNPMENIDYNNVYMSNDPSQQVPPNFLPTGLSNMNSNMMGPPPHFNNMGGFPPRPPMDGLYPPVEGGMDYYPGPDCPPPGPPGGPMLGRPPRGHSGHRGGPRNWGPQRGGPNNRNRGTGGGRGGMRGRVPCHHFMAGGCKYEESCKFLHPGVNGPRL